MTGQLEEKVRKAYYYDELSLIGTPSNVPKKGSPPDPYYRYNLTSVRTINPQNLGEYVTETFRYDDLGNLREITGPLGQGHTTVINFTDNFSTGGDRNSFAYPTSVTNAAGHQTFTQYHYETGLVTQTTDPRGLQSTFTYDGLNRPIGSLSPNGLATAVTYDDINRFVRETATVGADVRKVETYFDKFSRTFKVVGYDPAGNVQADTLYDASGRVSAVSEPYRTGSAVWTSTAYDAVDRPVTVTKPDGSVVQYSYPYVYSINETDEAGNGKVTSFMSTGEIFGVNDGILTTTYQHSMFGPLSVHQDGQWRTFTYDWLGRQSSASHPESGTTSYEYDVAGRMTSRTDARGVTSSTTYDVIDRPLVTIYSDGTPTVTRTYDQNGYVGFLTTIVDGAGTTTFTYNSAGQLSSESRTFNGVSGTFTTSYGYDLDGKLQSITYPSGRVVAYSYQSGGGLATSRLNSIVDQSMARTIVNNVEDNAAGQITSQTLGNGVVETRSFNTRHQITGIAATHASSGLVNLSFGDGNPGQNDGRIRSRTDSLQSEHSVQYTFDSGGRLTQAINDSWSVGWDYDVWANRLSQSPTGLATSRVGSQALAYWNNRNTSFSYDAAGNVLNDTVHNYAYDGESRMVQGDGGPIAYGYDFAGRRVTRTVGGQTTYYLYGIGGLLSEFTTADTGVTGWSANDRTRYIVSEQTGTPVLAIAQDGLVEENNRVFPFGESWLWETGTPFDPQFTTYLRDDETGLDYAMARNYASRGGRFVTSDPGHVGADIGDSQSWNAYVYAGNDPINLIDPLGLQSCPTDREFVTICVDVAEDSKRGILGTLKKFFGNVFKDTGTGGAKGTANLIIDTSNFGNALINSLISQFTDFQIAYTEPYEADTPGEAGAMLGLTVVTAVGPAAATVASKTGAFIKTAAPTLSSEVTSLTKFYPENAGFAGATERTFLMPGQTIDRYGGSGYSRFFSPQGTPGWARSLAPGTAGQSLRTFEVVKPFEVQSGTVAPWFNQLGGGLQYVTPVRLEILLKRGFIKEVTR